MVRLLPSSARRGRSSLPWAGGLALLSLGLLFGAAACGSSTDEAAVSVDDADGATPTSPRPERVRGGVLAMAGPDQRALPGMKVRLDARGSVRPEDGRPFTLLWTQEAGPRVSLDDPTAAVATFVAPERIAQEGDLLVFRLRLDDGIAASLDRVAVRLVDDPGLLLPAPVALGGADQEVRPGSLVELAVPSGEQPTWASPLFADPACILEGGDPSCAEAALPHCWTQVEGSPVALDDPCGDRPTFSSPLVEDVITFRLDAHRDDGENRSALCLPAGRPDPARPDCAGADYVRIFVRRSAWRTSPPTAKINFPDDVPRSGAVLRVERPSDRYPLQVQLSATAADPISQQLNTFYGFRPLLGAAPAGELISFELGLPRQPAWPGVVGVAFESQFRRLRAAPAAAILVWLPPTDRVPLLARASISACDPSSGGVCEPAIAGETITLDGKAPGIAAPASLEYCWEQLAGPVVELEPAGSCLEGISSRTFVAPEPPPGGGTLQLSFQLSIRDGGPLSSPPDVVSLRIRAAETTAPELEIVAPVQLKAGVPTLFDASRSRSPAELPLSIRWRQVRPEANLPAIELATSRDCIDETAPPGACVIALAPQEAVGLTLELEAIVSDSAFVTSTRRLSLPVVE